MEGNQQGFHTDLSVVAHQEKSAISGKIFEPFDVGAVRLDDGCDRVGDGLHGAPHGFDSRRMVQDRVSVLEDVHVLTLQNELVRMVMILL